MSTLVTQHRAVRHSIDDKLTVPTRLIEVFMPGDSLAYTEWAGHVSAVIRVSRDVLIRSAVTGMWRATSETAFFVSDIVLPADVCAKISGFCGDFH